MEQGKSVRSPDTVEESIDRAPWWAPGIHPGSTHHKYLEEQSGNHILEQPKPFHDLFTKKALKKAGIAQLLT
ncbi:hypothetical protein HGM15179_014053 [Zosterops borbonicus]|uniref:Uncharacterized protein n=1 Tax=Zosterops borbonicus TaxID=364589 RepID=A0A8K1LGJ0_9PASS|nr:hypothetical protein HGM15179_014053 [Zosterops borbonicus]